MNMRPSAESLHRRILMLGVLSMMICIGLSHADRPKTPLPSGLSFGFVDSTYTFSSRVFKPEGDSSAMRFAWGDGDTSLWSSYRINRSTIPDSHSWSAPGTYYIKAQAKDKHGVTLLWSRRCEIDISYCDTLLYWRYLTGSHVWSSPAIGSDGTVYVGSDGLYAINPDGTLEWRYQTDDKVYSSPAIGSDGTVYVKPMFDLYAINPDGTLKWRNSTLGIFNSPAIGSDGTIYVGSGDYLGYIQKPADVEPVERYLYAINPDGTLKWRYSTNGVLNSAAIGSDGTIYIGSSDHYLYAINPAGTLKWRYLTDGEMSSPAIGSDGTVYVGSEDDILYAINPDGTLKWRFLTGDKASSSPVIGSDGTVYVGSNDHCLYAINPDATLKWRYQTGGVLKSPAIGSDGTIYVGSGDHYLYAINPDGTLKWRFLTGDQVSSSPTIGSDGTVYVGSNDRCLYAIHGSGQLADAPWPQFRHGNKNTGRVGGGF